MNLSDENCVCSVFNIELIFINETCINTIKLNVAFLSISFFLLLQITVTQEQT